MSFGVPCPAVPGLAVPGEIQPGLPGGSAAPAPSAAVVFQLGIPYFQWAAGTPYLT